MKLMEKNTVIYIIDRSYEVLAKFALERLKDNK